MKSTHIKTAVRAPGWKLHQKRCFFLDFPAMFMMKPEKHPIGLYMVYHFPGRYMFFLFGISEEKPIFRQ
jgi:hypothetical protein